MSSSLFSLGVNLQNQLEEVCRHGNISLDGYNMDIAAVVATARHHCLPTVDKEEVLGRLSAKLETGLSTIYGVHTGFGGSADTRTDDSPSLKVGLLQLLQSGVLVDTDFDVSGHSRNGLIAHAMPLAWMKGIMAVRLNQCLRGHSAISRSTITSLLNLIAADVTPIVPLRGSISASGDLMPLAYVAGLLEGSTDVFVARGSGQSLQIMSANEVLAEIGQRPMILGPREALGLANGTAASAATASLAISDAVQLTLLATGLTCLVSEALAARVEWLHPFIAETRPHAGQKEAADIMRKLLQGSQLVTGLETVGNIPLKVRPRGGLAQDRYPLRTSPQWLGPQFEDLLAAYSQISIELNSTTDNPLMNPDTGSIHHGGNFQATSITSAAEKIRSSLQMVGKLLSSQCTEMINHHMNAGLPPNLAADDPSVSFCCKGLDISIAAYQSELSYLSNTMSNHVQSAEMHNQAVNSLALLSTRYTMQAIELLSLMVSGVLYAACQAMDLRIMHAVFLQEASSSLCKAYASLSSNPQTLEKLEICLEPATNAFRDSWWANSAVDAPERCSSSIVAFVQALCEPSSTVHEECLDYSARKLRELQTSLQAVLLRDYREHRAKFMQQPTTEDFIGSGSRILYQLVRKQLGIPMNRGLEDHPIPGGPSGMKSIGSHVSKIYEAVRDGGLSADFIMASKDI